MKRDDIGYIIVQIAANTAGEHEGNTWPDEFRDWYVPKQWLGSHRAASVFLGMKYRARIAGASDPT